MTPTTDTPRRVKLPTEDKNDTADKAQAPPTTTPPPRRGRATRDDKLREALANTYTGLAMGVAMYDGAYAKYIEAQSEHLADMWMDVAESNPRVKALIQKFTEGAGVGALIVGHGILFAPILAKRGILVPREMAYMMMVKADNVTEQEAAMFLFPEEMAQAAAAAANNGHAG